MAQGEIERKLAEATALQRRGETDAAAALYRQILKKHRDIAPAHYNLALLLKGQGKAQAAEKSFKAALSADPSYALGWRGYARFLSERGKHRDAVRAGLKLAAIEDYAPATLQGLADLMERAKEADLGAPGDEAMIRCLQSDHVESDRMILALLARIRRRRAENILDALKEPVIATAFASLILPDPAIEAEIDAARMRILAGEGADPDPEVMALLALQLELTEYALPTPAIAPPVVTGLETALRKALHSPLQPEMADEILEKGGAALENRPWCQLLLRRMGPEKMQEWKLAATLPTVSKSSDAVSTAVKEQYEESPYPRWRGLRSGGETTLAALLKSLFPALTLPVADKPKVLVAGCGTGRHALRTARRIEGAEVTAIDLSRRSLAYGARKAAELGIENVRFAEADLVHLPENLGGFDLIEACGVLHHMADPEAAWKGLLRFLAPRGVMKVALYSEEARQDVVAVRERVGAGLEDLTLEDMRRLRADILALPGDHPAKGVTKELDFYSLSGCRDLLFHRHEQRFDIPRIAAAMEALGLDFLGFEFVDPAVMAAYRARHPEDPSGRTLANWAVIEAENPMLFRGMYQFWCRVRK